MKRETKKAAVVVYSAKTGAIELRGDFSHETVWATQAQIGDILAKTSPSFPVISGISLRMGKCRKKAICIICILQIIL